MNFSLDSSRNESTSFDVEDIHLFKQKASYWANQFATFCILDNNEDKRYAYHSFEWTLAADALNVLEATNFEQLESYTDNKTVFGYLSYDLKNEIENLSSKNTDTLELPLLYFFEPRYLLCIKENKISINRNYPEAYELFETINKIELPSYEKKGISLKINTDKADYIKNVGKIQQHIKAGDVYELNYCVEYFNEQTSFDSLAAFNHINGITKSPFSSFIKFKEFTVLCFSPERFLRKEDRKLISQPIKGTIKKGAHFEEDEQLKKQLKNDEKERAENVMIVDLVRNDLTKSSNTGSIKVEELFEIYSFDTINQMISTITSECKPYINNTEIIKNTFPMGSMTGAPKIRAMQIIESIEKQKRGLYSGAIGYFNKNKDFDFNVVIRSLIYNENKKYLSLQVGGAITYDSVPEKEWQETKTKVQAIISAL